MIKDKRQIKRSKVYKMDFKASKSQSNSKQTSPSILNRVLGNKQVQGYLDSSQYATDRVVPKVGSIQASTNSPNLQFRMSQASPKGPF